jgi:hypothetical protein
MIASSYRNKMLGFERSHQNFFKMAAPFSSSSTMDESAGCFTFSLAFAVMGVLHFGHINR